MESTTFPQFARLPIEIQYLVWEFFVHLTPPRVINVETRTILWTDGDKVPLITYGELAEQRRGSASMGYFSLAPIPVALQISSLSRSISKTRWTLAFKTDENPARIWIDHRLDELVIGVNLSANKSTAPPGFYLRVFHRTVPKEDLSKVRNVQIMWKGMNFLRNFDRRVAPSTRRVTWLFGTFPFLKRLTIYWGDGEDVDWEQWQLSIHSCDVLFIVKITAACLDRGCVLEFVKMED